MATPLQIQRAAEQARKKRVNEYKKYVKSMEDASENFYKNELKRQNISDEEYATHLKNRSKRYADYSKEVLSISYMTEEEKLNLSAEYMLKSEQALTEHIERMREINRKNLDASMDLSSSYVKDRNYYSSWEEVGDNPVDAFRRVDEKLSKAVFDGTISIEEYYQRLKGFGSAMYEDRIANSNRWLAHETEMNNLSSEQYLEGLYRMQTYTSEYYANGLISHREYIDGMQSLEERIFNKKQEIHREIIAQANKEKEAIDQTAKAKIDALNKDYNQTLSDMDQSKRDEELAKLKAQERIWANSRTLEGKEKLEDVRQRIADINDDNRRAQLKENLEREKEKVLSKAERKKSAIDKNVKKSAFDLGLYFDEDEGYKMIANAGATFNGIYEKQQNFSAKSTEEMTLYNALMTRSMNESIINLTNKILESFSVFAAGVESVKNRIFEDVNAVNSLDFSRFGAYGGPIKTAFTYNDYGDKNITNTKAAQSFFQTLGNLIAKGVRV